MFFPFRLLLMKMLLNFQVFEFLEEISANLNNFASQELNLLKDFKVIHKNLETPTYFLISFYLKSRKITLFDII